MEKTLRIWIKRSDWENALAEAILTTPESNVYPVTSKWRKLIDNARIRVQWDPERNIRNEKLSDRSIQVGITPILSEIYAKKWIIRIEDCTLLTNQIRNLVCKKDFENAEQLLPIEKPYSVNNKIAQGLGMV